MKDGPLDMRMDKGESFSAYDVVNYYSEEELYKIFRHYGEERNSRRIAKAIVARRKEKKIEIIDNAGGIDEKIMPNLFRAGCTTKGEKGSGMGLYMSAQIAKKHNGQLLAENSAEGAKFTFILKEDA